MTTYWERLQPEMKIRAMGIPELAAALGVSFQAIAKVRDGGSFGSVNNFKAAQLFGLAPEWLARGKGLKKSPANQTNVTKQVDAPRADTNVMQGPQAQGMVPLISLVQAGNWSAIADTFQPGDAEEWLPCPRRHSSKTFCLTVKGDSMHSPGAKPSYADGDIIFVDPEMAAQVGDRVVVRLDDKDEATFKQLMEEDGRRYLKALNPDWKPRYIEINGNATICGVVIGKWVPE